MRRHILGAVTAATLIPAALTGCLPADGDTAASSRPDRGNPAPPRSSTATGTDITAGAARAALDRLNRLPMLPHRPEREGYERSCRSGDACSFGPAWTDNQNGPSGHNGCGTRDDVLAEQLDQVRKRGRCVVVAGVLDDPYTGKQIRFAKARAMAVQVDHVLPLSLAWDLGAHSWTEAKRLRFANDTRLNLIASDGPANMSKGDRGPSEWMPPNRRFHCGYSARVVNVLSAYDLPVVKADRNVLAATLKRCS